jgi:hypothetical protein
MRPHDGPGAELSPAEIEALNMLIRQSREEEPAETRIDEARLASYLQHQASAEEEQEVQEALSVSRKLREEVVYLAGLYDEDVQSRFDNTRSPDEEDAGSPEAEPETDRERSSERKPAIPARNRVAVSFSRWFRSGLPVAVLVALSFFMWRLRPEPPLPWSAQAALTIDQLDRDPRRGGADGTIEPRTSGEAATLAFLSAVEWDGQTFRFHPIDAPASDRHMVVKLKGHGDFSLEVPVDARDLELWCLSLPSLRTYRTALQRKSVTASWPAAEDGRAVFTLTYSTPSGFGAATPREVVRNSR